MERIIFGDNQFFGVNHMSEEKAHAQAIRFQDTRSIIDVLDVAYEAGIRAFMCTTHERVAEICDHFRANPDRYPDHVFYPCMPYAHKYANAVTENGALNALRTFLPDDGLLNTMVKGGKAVARADVAEIGQLLIDAEMKMFKGLQTPIVFLQNVVTDLLLGMGMKEAFRIFSDHVAAKYGAEAGFITMNLPRLLDTLDEVGIQNPIVCANINKVAFRMCGGIAEYEDAIRNRKFRPIAMSVFASGAIAPAEAIKYVCELENVQSIVFGASSKHNIEQTKHLIETYSPSPVASAG